MRPDQILIAEMMRFKGNKKVECRLKYRVRKDNIYSNPFFDHLNQKLFRDSL
jgi:hypothetical protein